MEPKKYELPKLTYGYAELKPFMSEEQLMLHHTKHHQAYVNTANAILDSLTKARKDGAEVDMKATLKALSFNVGGHALHSLFWGNLAPDGSCEKEPFGELEKAMTEEFGSFQRFRAEFTQAASSVEGSGWAVLCWDTLSGRPIIMQLEKHNANFPPGLKPILALDVWEHAYYLDYKNERAKYIEAFWNILNWDKVVERFDAAVEERSEGRMK
jgi:superoxide dismutase, Fe-Mn family